jgi:hypothetical protein
MNNYAATAFGLIALLTLGISTGYAKVARAKDDPDIAKIQADAAVIMNAEKGPAEIDNRLRRSLVLEDGMVMVHNQETSYGSYTFPATDRWAVQCGLGLTVVFGSTPRGDPNDIGTGPEIHLSYAQFQPEDCERLGFLVGKKVKDFLSGK